MYSYIRFQDFKNIHGYSAAADDQINRFRSSIKRASDRIDMHNQRIQAILAEEQNAGTAQSQNNSANNSDNNNN
jgi:ABC-type Fe2+-enterobactin transport system substrate-binding protein